MYTIYVKSKNPMYFINGLFQIEMLNNEYSDENKIVLIDNKTNKIIERYFDPNNLNLIPEIGSVMFPNQNQGNSLIKLFNTNFEFLYKNAINSSKFYNNNNKNIFQKQNKQEKIISGLYSIESFDNLLTINDLNNLCYIDEKRNIKKVKHFTQKEIEKYIDIYLHLQLDIDSEILKTNRMIFEVVDLEDNVFIDHMFMTCNTIKERNPYVFTKFGNFPIFIEKEFAEDYRTQYYNDIEYIKTQFDYKRKYEIKVYNDSINKETRNKILNIIFQIVMKKVMSNPVGLTKGIYAGITAGVEYLKIKMKDKNSSKMKEFIEIFSVS